MYLNTCINTYRINITPSKSISHKRVFENKAEAFKETLDTQALFIPMI